MKSYLTKHRLHVEDDWWWCRWRHSDSHTHSSLAHVQPRRRTQAESLNNFKIWSIVVSMTRRVKRNSELFITVEINLQIKMYLILYYIITKNVYKMLFWNFLITLFHVNKWEVIYDCPARPRNNICLIGLSYKAKV